MTILRLFLEFFKVGLFTFGGAYGAIPLIGETVVGNGWMSEDLFSYILGVAESTPGPIMVNTATYVGNKVGGVAGAVAATSGVVLPSFIIILLIARLFRRVLEKPVVRTVLNTVKPCVVGIITATGLFLFFNILWRAFPQSAVPDARALILVAMVGLVRLFWRIWKEKPIPPILSIALAACCGIAVYGIS